MTPLKFGIGAGVRRVEDARFLRGNGRYTADIIPPGALSGLVLRSPHAHARFAPPDVAAARGMPGVRAVLTAADTGHLGGLPCAAPMRDAVSGKDMALPPYPLLADGAARHAGDAIAFIVADDEASARAALEAVHVEYEPLPACASIGAAMAAGAPVVWKEVPGNIAYTAAMGDEAACASAFARAHKTARVKIINSRVCAHYMEPRAAIGEYDPAAQSFTLTATSQGVHGLRDTLAEAVLRVPREKLRVLTPDVGGGFGPKAFAYREYALVLEAARVCGRPVAWVGDRTEHFLADAHGRDNISIAEMAMDAAGRFLALRVDVLADLGAYLSQYAPYIPWLGITMATGPYDIGAFHGRLRSYYSHRPPVDAYRGAGRPEAAYLLERLVDECAREMQMPREEIRALNFIRPAQMPYKTLTERTYDVGDFEGAMRQALARADYAGFEARAARARPRGMLSGIGFASYIECTAWGEGEAGHVTLDEDGGFTVSVGTQSNGQGHHTAYAQIVSQALGVEPARVRLVQGDTALVPTGGGTGGSRSIPVGAAMLSVASGNLERQLKELAAGALEAPLSDLECADGGIGVAGTDRRLSYEQIARLPGANAEIRRGEGAFDPPAPTYPNGTHVCEVEIDPETGAVRIERYTVCDDFGVTLNPLLLEGQVMGGIAQGIGQALGELAVFGVDGQPLSTTLMDYALPRAAEVPSIQFENRNVPSTSNPLGLKGAGEAGTIGAAPAVMNAVIDALRRACGVRALDMPASAMSVLRALKTAPLTKM